MIVSARSFRPLPSTSRAPLEVQVAELEVRELGAPEAREEPGGHEGVVAEAERGRVLGERLKELLLLRDAQVAGQLLVGGQQEHVDRRIPDGDLFPHHPRLSRVPGQIVGE
jgi:hypothetical protein